MKNHYYIEMTDTFGGEANYCWVNRFIVSASSPRGAMRKVAKKFGYSVRDVGCDRWDTVSGATCFFVEWVDAAEVQRLKDNYSRIEVIK